MSHRDVVGERVCELLILYLAVTKRLPFITYRYLGSYLTRQKISFHGADFPFSCLKTPVDCEF